MPGNDSPRLVGGAGGCGIISSGDGGLWIGSENKLFVTVVIVVYK